jgi:vancomycin permeability regulator SanA
MKSKVLSGKSSFIISLVVMFNVLMVYYLKYSNHNLSLHYYNLFTVGNFLNLAFAVLIILGIALIYFRKIKVSLTAIWLTLVFMNLFLLSVTIINRINIPSSEYYLLSLSSTQVIIIIAFSLFQFLQLFLILLLWLNILKIEKLIYLRSAVNSVFAGFALLIISFIFINTRPFRKIDYDKNKKNNDIAIVLGAAVWSDNKPSPTLASRVDKAIELYKQGKVNKIQLTGGNAPGELSEAEVSLKYILDKGINRNDVWMEKSTTSTIEQVRFIRNNLIKEKQINSVIVISDKYHLQRVKEICQFYDIKADVAASDLTLNIDKIIFYQLRECIALLLFWLFAL